MNYQAENLAHQGFVYSCQHPVIDELLQSFPVTDDSVLNYSKPTLTAQTSGLISQQNGSIMESPSGPLVMVQTAAYEIAASGPSIKSNRPNKEKSYCDSEIDTFFVEASTINNVTDLSKQIDSAEDTYCEVQSQPMQLTLDTSSRISDCTKVTTKKIIHKATVTEGNDKACNYTILESWLQTEQISSIDRSSGYEQPQTQPLQLTQVNNDSPKKEEKSTMKGGSKKAIRAVGNASDKTNKCTICGKVMSSSNCLKDHLRIHSGERPFSCSECGYSVSKKSNLKAHKRLHSGERPYMCGLCYKLFTQSSHLTVHMVTHTGKKNHECVHCRKMFSTNSNLKKHVAIQHNEGGNGQESCNICGKQFACKLWLQEHTKVHFKQRPYQCDVCKKRFKGKFYVEKHKKKFCGNEGYAKRWQVPGVKKPPGRRKSSKHLSVADGLPKKPRGRPKVGRPKQKMRKKQIFYDLDEEECVDDPMNVIVNSVIGVDDNMPLALNTNHITSQNDATDCQKCQYDRNDNPGQTGASFAHCSLDNFSSVSNNSHQLTVGACDESSILELDLSAETILDFTKQDSHALQQCFAEPQNLSSSSSNMKHTNEGGNSSSINNSNFTSDLSDMNVYVEPQNLTLPQNLSMHQQITNAIETVEPQNLCHPQKFLSHPLWDLSNIQPENLAEPQNLSLAIEPQNLSVHHNLTQPQNLSLGQALSQPQNLTHTGNVSNSMHQSHINNNVNQLSHVHNLSTGLLTEPNSLQNPHTFTHTHDFTQPQNLTIDQRSLSGDPRSYNTQSQPQNLVLPQNLSFSSIL